jgi:hypothetical protein
MIVGQMSIVNVQKENQSKCGTQDGSVLMKATKNKKCVF